jgi:hypothetical protein
LFDYAAILLETEKMFYYVIHGGCPCYLKDISSKILIIKFDEDLTPVYIKGSQNIPLA